MTLVNKKRFRIVLAIAMVFTMVIGTISVTAASLSDVNQEIEDAEDALAAGEEELEYLNKTIYELTKEISEIEAEIESVSASIASKEAELEEKEAELEKKQEELQESTDNLNERLRNMYKNGSLGFLDVILSSGSVSEMILNLELVQMIYESDQDVVTLLQDEYDEIEEQKVAIEEMKAELESEETSLAASESSLTSAKAAYTVQQDEVTEENIEIENQIAELQAEADALTSQLEDGSLGNSSSSDGSDYSGGEMYWPCTSRTITSGFGTRIHPITGLTSTHTGIDISSGVSGANIYAANSGTVIYAGWYGGYGNAIMIDHGGGIVTLYGHLNSINVYVGQTVSRGQVIGGEGTTGNSTGVHLHFEVRVNGSYVDPTTYLY